MHWVSGALRVPLSLRDIETEGIVRRLSENSSLVYWYFAALAAILVYQVPWCDWVLAA